MGRQMREAITRTDLRRVGPGMAAVVADQTSRLWPLRALGLVVRQSLGAVDTVVGEDIMLRLRRRGMDCLVDLLLVGGDLDFLVDRGV